MPRPGLTPCPFVLKLETWQGLCDLSPSEVIRRMANHDPSVAPSDTFLAVVALNDAR